MSTRVTQLVAQIAGTASILMAVPAITWSQSTRDSLGLRALNRATQIIPGELSIDFRLGDLRRQAPDVHLTTAAGSYGAWTTLPRADRLSASFVFRSDSGGLLDRRITANAPLAAFQAYVFANDTITAFKFHAALTSAASELGPPDFCDRDTVTRDTALAIHVSAIALWRRGEVQVQMRQDVNLSPVHPLFRQYAQRFFLTFDAIHSTDRLVQIEAPTRHDTPCLLTEAEFRSHGVPLDSAEYDSLHATLIKRAPVAGRRQHVPD